MIADDFDSIKKALEEILKEKEKEKAPKEPQPGYVYDAASDRFVPAASGGLKGSQAISGIWGNIVWASQSTDQQADAQQAPVPTGQPSAVIRPAMISIQNKVTGRIWLWSAEVSYDRLWFVQVEYPVVPASQQTTP